MMTSPTLWPCSSLIALQAVEVQEKQRERLLASTARGELALDFVVEVATVVEAGKFVARRHLFEFGELDGELGLVAVQQRDLHAAKHEVAEDCVAQRNAGKEDVERVLPRRLGLREKQEHEQREGDERDTATPPAHATRLMPALVLGQFVFGYAARWERQRLHYQARFLHLEMP